MTRHAGVAVGDQAGAADQQFGIGKSVTFQHIVEVQLLHALFANPWFHAVIFLLVVLVMIPVYTSSLTHLGLIIPWLLLVWTLCLFFLARLERNLLRLLFHQFSYLYLLGNLVAYTVIYTYRTCPSPPTRTAHTHSKH